MYVCAFGTQTAIDKFARVGSSKGWVGRVGASSTWLACPGQQPDSLARLRGRSKVFQCM